MSTNLNPKLTTFETGAIRDTNDGKEDYLESLSFSALRRFAKYMKSKESTYGPGNWKKGIPIESYEKSLLRHIQKYFANKYEGAELEPDEDHLAAAWFNLQGIIHEQETYRAPVITPEEWASFKYPDHFVTNGFSATSSGESWYLPHAPNSYSTTFTLASSDSPLKMDFKEFEDIILNDSEMTNEEKAKALNISTRTLYHRLARARKNIQ